MVFLHSNEFKRKLVLFRQNDKLSKNKIFTVIIFLNEFYYVSNNIMFKQKYEVLQYIV